jgi:hypothetical protein
LKAFFVAPTQGNEEFEHYDCTNETVELLYFLFQTTVLGANNPIVQRSVLVVRPFAQSIQTCDLLFTQLDGGRASYCYSFLRNRRITGGREAMNGRKEP